MPLLASPKSWKVLEFSGKSWKSPGAFGAKVLEKMKKCPEKYLKVLEFEFIFLVATLQMNVVLGKDQP